MTVPDSNTILEALRRDSVYGRPDRFEQVKDFAVTLPEIIADYLNLEVTPRRFFEVRFQVCLKMMRETLYHQGEFFLDTLVTIREWRENPELAFAFADTTEADYLFSDHVGLTEPLKQRLRNGQLKFVDILREQPGVFLL